MIVIKEKIFITNYTIDQAKEIKKLLTLPNPVFNKKQDMGFSVWGIPTTLQFYEEQDNLLIAPIGSLQDILSVCGNLPIDDQRFTNKKQLDIKFLKSLYDYQEEAVTHLFNTNTGVLEAPTGSGKTICICNLICKHKQPTLILTHTKELQKQFKEKLEAFTTIDKIGLIGDNKFEVENITVALLQSMNNLSDEVYDELNSRFGMVYLDEAHISPAETFYKTLNKLTAKLKYGGSGTPFRNDGLTKVIFFALGPIVHRIEISEIKQYLSSIEYVPVETDYFFPLISSDEYIQLMKDLVEDKNRTQFIVDTCKPYLNSPIVFLSTRVEHLHELQKLVGSGVVLTSKTPKKQRETIISDFLNHKNNIIFSTYQLFATGIDIPHLEYIVFCAPMRSEIIIKQAVGRVMRKFEGKVSKVIDFVDNKVSLLKYQAYARKRVITKIQKSFNTNEKT